MRDFHRTDFKIWMTYIRSRFIQFCAILKTSWRMYAQRQTIIDLYRARKKPVDIARTLKIDRDAVWRTVRRFEERGDLKDRQKCGRPCTVRTAAERINSCEQRIKRVRERIRRNPLRSIRKMARQEATSPTSMRNIVKRPCLECHQFDRIWSSSQPKQPRWSGSKDPGSCLTKSRTRRSSARLSFFDEKVFTVEQAFNRKTDLIVSKTVKDIPKSLKTVSRRQKPLSVMVWGAVSKTCKSPLIFVPEGFKMNSEVNIDKILSPFLRAANSHCGEHAWTFQQDGAPSHTSKKTQAWCVDHLPRFWSKNMWPPSSPDVNVMDFSIWSILESEACANFHTSIDSLTASLSAAWERMCQETVRAAVDSF